MFYQRFPLGLAASLGGRAWLQAGAGVTRPSALDPSLPEPSERTDQKPAPFIGAQLTGHFSGAESSAWISQRFGR